MSTRAGSTVIQTMTRRIGMSELKAHLEASYDVTVTDVSELDLGVLKVTLDDGRTWVARVFSQVRPIDEVRGDAAVLRALEKSGFPAERCADPGPVTVHHGQGVLVTEFVNGERAIGNGHNYAVLGELMGRLHLRNADTVRPGGAWHHLAPLGGPREEIAAASAMLEELEPIVPAGDRSAVAFARDRVEAIDDCAGLPEAFIHPDFVPANAIATPEGKLAILDWTGAGRGPRLWSLGWLLYAAGARDMRLVGVVASRYRRHIQLERDELSRLEGALSARAIILECWRYGAGHSEAHELIEALDEIDELAGLIAARADLGG